MVSLTRWTWIWVSYRSWWWTGKPGVLQSMGWQRVRHYWVTELNWVINIFSYLLTNLNTYSYIFMSHFHIYIPMHILRKQYFELMGIYSFSNYFPISVQFSHSVWVQSLSHVWLFATPWTAACQASLSITISWTCSDSCLLSWWCYLTISSSVALPFSSCPQSFPASGSFPMSWLFISGDQILEFQLQHQSFQWKSRTDLL